MSHRNASPLPIVCHTLSNGMRAWLLPCKHLQAVEVDFIFRGGPRFEDRPLAGISHFLEHMLFKGSLKQSQFQILRQLEGYGATFDATTGRESVTLAMIVPGKNLRHVLPLFAELILTPAFEGLEPERRVILREAQEEGTDDGTLESNARPLMWPGSPMFRPILGNKGSVSRIDENHLRSHHTRSFVTDNCRISMAGGFELSAAKKWLESSFVHLPQGPALPLGPVPQSPTLGPIIHQTWDGHGMGSFMLSLPGPGFSQPEFAAFLLLQSLLQDGTTSQLQWALTEREGLSYSAFAQIDAYSQVSILDIMVRVPGEDLISALATILAILGRLAVGHIPQSDFEFARARLHSRRLIAADSPSSIVSESALYDLFQSVPKPMPTQPSALVDIAKTIIRNNKFVFVSSGYSPHDRPRIQELIHGTWTP